MQLNCPYLLEHLIEPAGRGELPGQTASVEHGAMGNKALVNHEEGHNFGLAHVSGSGNNLMNETPTSTTLAKGQLKQIFSAFTGMKDGRSHMGGNNAQREAKEFVSNITYPMTKIKQKKQVSKILILATLFIIGCNNNHNEKEMESLLSLQNFSISFRNSISPKLINQTVDGDNGKLLVKSSDTVSFNFGYDINTLAEKDPSVIYYPYNEDTLRSKLDTSLVNPDEIIYTKKINFDIDEFRKQNIYFETIDGYKAKITVPREIKNGGITGVYVDSLRKDDGGRLKFNLYAKNLDSTENQNLLKAIRSIRFHLK